MYANYDGTVYVSFSFPGGKYTTEWRLEDGVEKLFIRRDDLDAWNEYVD
jgi:hypothetical protein